MLTNIFIEVQDSLHARGISYLTLYRHVGTESLRAEIPVPSTLPTAVGHYEDAFVLTDAGWRFKTRTLHVAFRNRTAPSRSRRADMTAGRMSESTIARISRLWR